MNKELNVFEINHIYLVPEASFNKLVPKDFKHTSLLYCVLASIFKIFLHIIRTVLFVPLRYKFAGIKRYANLYDRTIFFRVPTLNNKRSVEKIITTLMKERENVKVIETPLNYESEPILLMDFVSLLQLPSLWNGFIKLNKEERLIVNFFLSDFLYTPGVVWFYEKMLKSYKPECVVLANDHTFFMKSLVLSCEKYDIPCIYVQHASVSYAFPELRFSHSFLDGVDPLKKYTSVGKDSIGNIILLGAARYDDLSKYRINRSQYQRKCVGISINMIDDNAIVNELCEGLLQYFPDWKIKVRMHPSMKANPFTFSEKERIINTCATDETIIDYLDSIDVHISNDSCVHLDAILGGVRSIAYNMSRFLYGDNYQYVKSGMIRLADDVEQVYKFIEDTDCFCMSMDVIRLHDASYGMSYAGNCQDIIAQFILSGLDMKWLEKHLQLQRMSCNETLYYSAATVSNN